MKNYDVVKPIGLGETCNSVSANCSKAAIFKRSGLKPHHYIIHLDAGQGRSTLLEYIADMYKNNEILNFGSGLDDYLELCFDGTYNNFRNAVETVLDAAVYSDSYKGVIGINASALAAHRQETQWAEFNTFMKEISKSANLIFFVDYEPSKYDEFIINAVKSNISNVEELFETPYSFDEYVDIIVRNIEDKGINIENQSDFKCLLIDVVSSENIAIVKDAIRVADEIIQFADFSEFVPTVSAVNIKSLSNGKSILGGTK